MKSIYKVMLEAAIILLFINYLSSCKKFVEIPPPVNQLVTASVFDNNNAATAAMTAIYTQMQGYESYFMAQNTGLLSDELNNYSTAPYLIGFYTNSMGATTTIDGGWGRFYNYIYQANAILTGLQNTSGVSNTIKMQLIGESKFVRAFWHFYLTNLYGDVPLVTSTDYTINSTMIRTPQALVYKQIIADLKDAENSLGNNYVDGSDTTTTTERVRPTKWAAAAMLARTYLYLGKYDSAETQAAMVIDNTSLYSLCPNLSGPSNSVFLKNSSEAIWQLQQPTPFSNGATNDGINFTLISAPGTGVGNSNTISSQLRNTFEPGDNRKTSWIGAYTPDSITYYYFPYKYQDYLSSSVTEYVMVLRLAEQYLIRSEAETKQGDLIDAVNDLNVIRNRAGLANISDSIASSQPLLLTAILHERQVELFTEWGHRWFDLIRTRNVNTVMSTVSPQKGGTWSTDGHQLLYPIPQSELISDPKLTQNPGY